MIITHYVRRVKLFTDTNAAPVPFPIRTVWVLKVDVHAYSVKKIVKN